MATITLSDILDDLRAADRALRKFEQRYWLSSEVFYDLYSHGRLDNGEHLEDFSEWAGFYKVKQHREQLLRQLSEKRVDELSALSEDDTLELAPKEPVIQIPA